MGFLAIDVGGTKTEIGYFEPSHPIIFQFQKLYKSQEHESLESIIADFLNCYRLKKIEAIGIGIAGPVIEGVCHTTNLPWIVDQHKIQNAFHLKNCVLINDLVANAYGVFFLEQEKLITIQKGIQNLKGNKALISPGTGLGEAGIFFDGEKNLPFPTEGGHCDFAPLDQEEVLLWQFLKEKFSHVSYERILSGQGFYSLYQFYTNGLKEKKEPAIEEAILSQKPRLITQLAIAKQSETCQKVVNRFIKILAAEAANLSLKMYALGGLFIGGGIITKILPVFSFPLFITAFKEKGRFHDWLNFITVQIINDEKTALKGAAYSILNKNKLN